MKSDPPQAFDQSPTGETQPEVVNLSFLRHELRTPINHILGYCELLLEEGQLAGAGAEDLRRIHAAGRELQALLTKNFDEKHFSGPRDLHQLYHDLRTPANHIIGYSDLLIEQAEDSGKREPIPDLTKIRGAATHWLALMEAHLMGPIPADSTDAGVAAASHPRVATRTPSTAFALPEPKSALGPFQDEGAILVVDDDESSREMLARRLRRLGYTVSAVSNGLHALNLALRQEFDLVMLDLVMPEIDGFQVLGRLQADPALKHLPVIVLSGLDDENGIARCIEMGATDYLAKPFNPVFLRARISACLEKKRLRDREVTYLRQIQEEQRRSEELLHIILPRDVATELKATNLVQPRRFERVAVVFCDIVGFTAWCEKRSPEEVLPCLQGLVEAYEKLATQYSLEKIKTIGDAFMATAGMLVPLANPTLDAVRCGLAMAATARALPPHWQVRVGIHFGPVIAGVVGRSKYQYDVWGDTVNTAMRMAQAATPGAVYVNQDTWMLLGQSCRGQPRGRLPIKGKGELDLFQIEAVTDSAAA